MQFFLNTGIFSLFLDADRNTNKKLIICTEKILMFFFVKASYTATNSGSDRG
jgi:hypothetical protein